MTEDLLTIAQIIEEYGYDRDTVNHWGKREGTPVPLRGLNPQSGRTGKMFRRADIERYIKASARRAPHRDGEESAKRRAASNVIRADLFAEAFYTALQAAFEKARKEDESEDDSTDN